MNAVLRGVRRGLGVHQRVEAGVAHALGVRGAQGQRPDGDQGDAGERDVDGNIAGIRWKWV